MGFLGNILGGIFKVILSPLIGWIMSMLYGLLVHAPLVFLNSLDHSFQYVSGSQVDKMLFGTSITDGHPQINFFASGSPLKMFFLIILGVAGALVAMTLGIVLITSVFKNKSSPLKKMGRMTMSASIVFVIPLFFLITLSLCGSVMGAISGQHINMSQKNISVYSQVTTRNMDKLQYAPQNASRSFMNDSPIPGVVDASGNQATYTLNDIYSEFKTNAKITDDSIKEIAKTSQDEFKTFRDLVVRYDNGQFVLNDNLQNKIVDVRQIINNIKPNIKNEEMADRVKSLQDYLQSIDDAANKWVEDSNLLISYQGANSNDPQNIAISNFRKAFEYMYGRSNNLQLQNINSVTNIQELIQVIGSLVSGDVSNPESGLVSLRQHLTDFAENTLVVTFYQVATGNKDTNWDRSMSSFSNDGFMILVGSALIIVACVIMILAILFAIGRIFNIALLFVISPAVVLTSAFDDGARMKTWTNLLIAKLISVFGIVISLRLFGSLNTEFKHMLDSSNDFSGNSGYMVKLILTGMFGIGGMLAAYQSSQTLSGIVGAGYGISEGFQARQALSVLKGAGRVTTLAGGGIASILGLRSTRTSSGGGTSSSSGQQMPMASSPFKAARALGNVSDTWKQRAQNTTDKVTALTGGKVGSARSKIERQARVDTRNAFKQENKSQKQTYRDTVKNWNKKSRDKK